MKVYYFRGYGGVARCGYPLPYVYISRHIKRAVILLYPSSNKPNGLEPKKFSAQEGRFYFLGFGKKS